MSKIQSLKVTVDTGRLSPLDFDPIEDFDIFGDSPEPKKDDDEKSVSSSGDDSVTFRVTMDEKKTEERLLTDKEKAEQQFRPKPIDLDLGNFDPDAPENEERRLARAKRFGIEGTAADYNILSDQLEKLYESQGIDRKSKLLAEKYRLDTVFVKGVDDMSTYDILRYFAEFFPDHVEWINDSSCNVCWKTKNQAAKCLLEMGRQLKRVKPPKEPEEGELSSSSQSDVEEHVSPLKRKEKDGDSEEKMEAGEGPSEKKATELSKDAFEPMEIDVTQHVVPPGKWRVGVNPHEKSNLLLLRFATIRDVKEEGAQFRSEYYRKHGNPNFGGFQGLISGSMKRRLGLKGNEIDLRQKLNADEDLNDYGDSENKWMNRNKIRPGLKVFDDDGRELDWDYEHDTRFYDKSEGTVTVDASNIRVGRSEPIRSKRGRSHSRSPISSSNSDDSSDSERLNRRKKIHKPMMMMRADAEEKKIKIRRSSRSAQYVRRWSDEEDFGDIDSSPTPQPWDPPSDIHKMKVTVDNTEQQRPPRRRPSPEDNRYNTSSYRREPQRSYRRPSPRSSSYRKPSPQHRKSPPRRKPSASSATKSSRKTRRDSDVEMKSDSSSDSDDSWSR